MEINKNLQSRVMSIEMGFLVMARGLRLEKINKAIREKLTL